VVHRPSRRAACPKTREPTPSYFMSSQSCRAIVAAPQSCGRPPTICSMCGLPGLGQGFEKSTRHLLNSLSIGAPSVPYQRGPHLLEAGIGIFLAFFPPSVGRREAQTHAVVTRDRNIPSTGRPLVRAQKGMGRSLPSPVCRESVGLSLHSS